MLELVFSMALLLIALTVFAGQVRMLTRMERAFTRQGRCALVMDNTLERLAARGSFTAKEAAAVLAAELEAMDMSDKGEVSAHAEWIAGKLQLRLDRAADRPIISLEVAPCVDTASP